MNPCSHITSFLCQISKGSFYGCVLDVCIFKNRRQRSNKTVLLHDRKRHTAHAIHPSWFLALGGGGGGGEGGVPQSYLGQGRGREGVPQSYLGQGRGGQSAPILSWPGERRYPNPILARGRDDDYECPSLLERTWDQRTGVPHSPC